MSMKNEINRIRGRLGLTPLIPDGSPENVSKFTPQRVNIILDCVKKGMPLQYASAIAGVTVGTVKQWAIKYQKFSDRLRLARAHFAEVNIDFINKARPKDWRSAAWMLERGDPQNFSNKVDMKVQGEVTFVDMLNKAIDTNEVTGDGD